MVSETARVGKCRLSMQIAPAPVWVASGARQGICDKIKKFCAGAQDRGRTFIFTAEERYFLRLPQRDRTTFKLVIKG
jgi:hypothetical protein